MSEDWGDISDQEQEDAQELMKLVCGGFADVRPALVRGRIGGVQVAVVCAAKEEEDVDDVTFWPVAVLVTGALSGLLEMAGQEVQP